MKKKDLAYALNISAPMVTKLAARGMPTHCLEAALSWRRRNIDPARAKGVRFDTAKGTPMSVITAVRMGELALKDFSTWIDDYRAALRAVPVHHRAKVLLPLPPIRRMVAEARAIVSENDAGSTAENTCKSDEDAELGSFWYSVAAGEFLCHEGKIVAVAQPANELLAAF